LAQSPGEMSRLLPHSVHMPGDFFAWSRRWR
jgi:hypothetical protein